MSVEEDTELRDLLTQILENNGSLAKIRAQLRACLFLAFHEDEVVQKKQPLLNSKIQSYIGTAEGKLMFCLVREFLEYFDLDYTISVYEPETHSGAEYFYKGRNKLMKDLKLEVDESDPLLLQVIRKCSSNNTLHNGTNGVDTPAKDHVENPLNQTYDLSNEVCDRMIQKGEEKEEKAETPRSSDDTYEGTSSIAEDSIREKYLIDLDKSVRSNSSQVVIDSPRSLLDTTVNDFSQPLLKDQKNKLSPQKQEKLKGKANLASLADLPPLQLNKSRNNETILLPSLYSNDFKDKLKLFDGDGIENYEEDFMSGSELDLKSDRSFVGAKFRERNDSAASSVTSDDFELNSNVDDILKSNRSN